MGKTVGSGRAARRRRTPEDQEKRDRRARLGQELSRLREIPPIPRNETPPARGPLLRRAMSDPVKESMGPYKHKLFCLVAAYADAGDSSPQMRSLAARMGSTVPNVMFLLRALE